MFNYIIGIDISKQTLDWCLMSNGKVLQKSKEPNTIGSIVQHLDEICRTFSLPSTELLVCAEYTGKYIYPLTVGCHKAGVTLWLENAYLISLSAKRERGKSDSVDARRIAQYAAKEQEHVREYKLPTENIARLKQLIALEQDMVVQQAKYAAKIKDSKGFYPDSVYSRSVDVWKSIADEAGKQIKQMEKEMKKLIQEDPLLKRQNELLMTVPGVGPKTARAMIAATEAFRKFSDARKFCCYAGVAPFSYNSGTSVHSKRRVSDRANKDLKKQLHLSAMTAATVCKSGILRDYYMRKQAEGKNNMSILNALRAKMVTIMFAVIRENKPFDPNHEYRVTKAE